MKDELRRREVESGTATSESPAASSAPDQSAQRQAQAQMNEFGSSARGYGHAYSQRVSLDSPAVKANIEEALRVIESSGVPIIFNPSLEGTFYAEAGNIYYGRKGAEQMALARGGATVEKGGQQFLVQDLIDSAKAHELVHVAQGAKRDIGGAFAGETRRLQSLQSARNSIPPTAMATAGAVDVAITFMSELGAYRKTGAPARSLEEYIWASSEENVQDYQRKFSGAAKKNGIAKITDTRSLRDWVHYWLSLSESEWYELSWEGSKAPPPSDGQLRL